MSGTLFLIGEIVVFMIAATAIGFIVGRITRRRSPAGINVAEVTALRERSSLMEREVDELRAALTDARSTASRGAEAGELQSRAAMAEREAEGLERRLREASERINELAAERDEWMEVAAAGPAEEPVNDVIVAESDATPSAAEIEELETLRAEVERRRAEIARLEQVAADAARLESELAARNNRIGDLEAALEANVANRAHAEGDAASIGISMGAGNYADSRLEFEAWDPTDES